MPGKITQAFWDAIAAANCANAFSVTTDGSQFFYDPSLTAAEIAQIEAVYAAHDPDILGWTDYRQQAAEALTESDKTVLRCGENQIPVPAAWANYRKALRAIVGAATPGDPTQPLPVRPAFPAGT